MRSTAAQPADAKVAAEWTPRYDAQMAQYGAQLTALADWAETQGLADEAHVARTWVPPRQPNRLRLACRPGDDLATPKPTADQSPEFSKRFITLRHDQAVALFSLAKDAVAAGSAARAFALLAEVIREAPDHAEARKILGYEQVDGRWLTPFEARKFREGQVWHDRFGWLPADHVKRYEAGERFFGNRWLKAADVAQRQPDARHGWKIGTEHYVVQTNADLEEGVRLATRLERLHDVWQQLFAGFVAGEEQLARRFAGQAAKRTEPRRHNVVYFRNRDDYVKTLQREQPNIEVSTGFYLARAREAYFYAHAPRADEASKEGDADEVRADDTNLYHEATHQLFSETRPVTRDLGREANFWIIEGIDCYMESLVEQGDLCLLGGNDAQRLRDAQHRLLVDGFYVPLDELCGYGMDQLQRDSRISKLYSQSAGLAHFLMHFDRGRYRTALIDYLVAVYTGRDRPDTLAKTTGTSDAKLDEQYRAFLKSIDGNAE